MHKYLIRAISIIPEIGLFLLITIAIGTLSSWYAIELGTPFNVARQGPWIRWTSAGLVDSDPYSRAHFSNRELLPLDANIILSFEAAHDDHGKLLHSSFDYLLEGRNINAPWWMIAVFDAKGKLIPNNAQRYSFNSENVAYNPNGSFAIRLAREARPYNWLPTMRAGYIKIIFEAHRETRPLNTQQYKKLILPSITRISCR